MAILNFDFSKFFEKERPCSHLVFHENYEAAAVFGAIMMPTRGTLTILAIGKQSIQTTLDRMIRNCRGRYQVWYEDREKAITFCCITSGMTDYTTVDGRSQDLQGRERDAKG